MHVDISSAIRSVGVDDFELERFESQFPTPDGMAYNSYLILDERVAILDSVDARCTKEWLSNLERSLSGRCPDYLIIHHMEPDHSGSLIDVLRRSP
ncbi:MAG: FprA family A-type flavoprotein, partial [Rikenellaceae bacterium]|nr:FprA family A-type flavoprotein [Rikenellaceae bacterium]